MLVQSRFELVPSSAVDQQIPHLPSMATVSVTSSPRRGLEPTLLLCEHLTDRGFWAVPHLAARLVEGPEHLGHIVQRLEGCGVREIFVVGGDSAQPAGPFESALSLLRALADGGHGFERVGIAGYP